ncbi:E3 ubiquitin/ISG15 ligase TRIM25-like [Xenopus tropicalis]|uniref:E3 ubiquitin/ISG15 ligase TRIM25-like n=1 Tax=Xenopus tropicalis TaxID=8364 RepID=A0A8J1IU86_XENTR|nr:E3 ubiquitin/ISG15 ligase TRIM25-like [Xenopus tropicalis]
MAAADLREELNCSICWDIYTDPVTLPCGHSFCQGCIGRTWDGQKEIGETPSCPECRQRYRRQPELKRNLRLRNIAERLLSALPKSNGTGVLCTYCVHAPVPAAKSCLLCETSLCGAHITAHIKSLEHVLIKPTTSFSNRKCSRHKKLLEYYCCYDGACICASCCLAGGHWGHCLRALKEASEKKKKKLRKVLEKLSPKIKETEREVQRLQERSRDMEERAAGETERVTDLFKNIRYRLEALEKRVLSEVSRQKEELSLTFTSLIRELEIKKDEMSRMIRHIEELSLDMHLVDLDISETLVTGLAGIVTRIKGRIWGQKTMDLVLDTNSAANNVSVSGDRKCASFSRTDQRHPLTPDRFESSQVLSTKSFPSGRCYWEMEDLIGL